MRDVQPEEIEHKKKMQEEKGTFEKLLEEKKREPREDQKVRNTARDESDSENERDLGQNTVRQELEGTFDENERENLLSGK